jgi:3-deoxy-manno-octulosonate cytidylyltransferase (CMP-KDO synthetase)
LTREAVEFVVIVPARRASTRLPDKPLIDILGLPLVVRSARQAQSSSAARVLVATDDTTIMAVCEEHGVEAVMTRADHASGTDRIAEVAARLQLSPTTLVVNVQGDEPLIAPALIDDVASALAKASDCDMATACHPLSHPADLFNPSIVKVVCNADGRALYFSRAPIPFARDRSDDSAPCEGALRHVGVYAYRLDYLLRFPGLARAPLESIEMLEQLRALWHGARIVVVQSRQVPAPGVDTKDDLALVRQVLVSRQGKS